MDEISENIFNEELDKLFMVKIQSIFVWHSGDEGPSSSRMPCKKFAKKLKKFERRCYQEEILKNNEDWKNFQRSMIRNHDQ